MEKKQTNPMGKVFTPLTIINRADESAAARGFISPSEIRGSSRFCLIIFAYGIVKC
jgi:hypothetical protein